MRFKAFPFVLVTLLLVSMTFVACGNPAEFILSNLTVSDSEVDVGDEVTISVDVENIGGKEGDFTVNFSVDGQEITKDVNNIRAGRDKTATIKYTPQTAKTYAVTVDNLSASFAAIQPSQACVAGTPSSETDEWWEFDYELVDGEILLKFSLEGALTKQKVADFDEAEMTIKFSKANVTDGYRDVIIPGESFVAPPIMVEDIMTGIDMDLTLTLEEKDKNKWVSADAVGKLFVEDDADDADVTSETTTGGPEFSYSGGTPAGGMLLDAPLKGFAETTVGQVVTLPMPVKLTTGESTDTASKPGFDIDGSTLSGEGMTFCDSGDAVAPYVGTSGTLICTGSALGLTLVGMNIDFQFKIIMELEPK